MVTAADTKVTVVRGSGTLVASVVGRESIGELTANCEHGDEVDRGEFDVGPAGKAIRWRVLFSGSDRSALLRELARGPGRFGRQGSHPLRSAGLSLGSKAEQEDAPPPFMSIDEGAAHQLGELTGDGQADSNRSRPARRLMPPVVGLENLLPLMSG
jgi:hypothetical protein